MIRRLCISTLAAFSLAANLALAADADKPTMNPEAPAASNDKKNPFGLNVMGKERPKDAKTEITAKKQATFDNAANVAQFEGSVIVVDPQFKLFCDVLKVTLRPDRKGMQLVEATGNVIIVQENTDDSGQKAKSIGRSGKALYDPATGLITLTIWPQIQQGINNHVSTEEGTIMKLNREGQSVTEGGNRTVIINSPEAGGTP